MIMRYLLFFLLFLIGNQLNAQFTHDDTLRGSITKERAWWDVLHYQIHLQSIDAANKTIAGEVTLKFKVVKENETVMQLDLQQPLNIDNIRFKTAETETNLAFSKVGKSAYWITIPPTKINQRYELIISYSGSPIEAKNAPWDGGVVWTKDPSNNDFIASACQGIGASSWWPCKDHQSDEPQEGARIILDAPAHLMGVSNGLLVQDTVLGTIHRTVWEVKNPINNYGINFNVGNYTYWNDVYKGEKGNLPLSFYVLKENLKVAQTHFLEVYRMLEAFEDWLGPYPFYEDGYKLVQVPYLGMEHQSAVSYGNGFTNGYLNSDLSETGWGMNWDFIIIHESGHEWFGNSITSSDIADMWIHEAFTTFTEEIFTEYYWGPTAGDEYIRGIRHRILNDEPIIGKYNVQYSGTSDMYFKGANLLHTIRQIVNNDAKWKQFFRDFNLVFRHKITTTEEVEKFMSAYFNIDLTSVFNQYLRTTNVPSLYLKKKGKYWVYKWDNVVNDFSMPLHVMVDDTQQTIVPTLKQQKLKAKCIAINNNYYIKVNGRFF